MEDYSPKVGYATETEQEWRRRLDHRLSNIERLLFHLQDTITSNDEDYWTAKFQEIYGSKR
jgi:hypothetical protein